MNEMRELVNFLSNTEIELGTQLGDIIPLLKNKISYFPGKAIQYPLVKKQDHFVPMTKEQYKTTNEVIINAPDEYDENKETFMSKQRHPL